MGMWSTPADKAAYYKDQAAKARRDSAKAKAANNPAEAERLKDVARKADLASVTAQQQAEESAQ